MSEEKIKMNDWQWLLMEVEEATSMTFDYISMMKITISRASKKFDEFSCFFHGDEEILGDFR